MKKAIYITIFMIIFISITNINICYADDISSFELVGSSGNGGDEITLNFYIKDNPSFGLLGVKFYYDTSSLEYIDSSIIGFDKAFMKNVGDNDGTITMYALTISSENLIDDTGNILELKFKVITYESIDSTINVKITDYGIDETTSLQYTVNDTVIELNGGEQETVDSETELDDDKNLENVTWLSSDGSVATVDLGAKLDDDIDLEDVTWLSSDESVATVDSTGLVTFTNKGEVVISATNDDGEVVYEKEFTESTNPLSINNVEESTDKNNNLLIFIITAIVIFAIIIIFYLRKKYVKNKS